MKSIKHIFIFILLQTTAVHAQTAGKVDLSFGNNGYISTTLDVKYDEGISAEKILRQSDGKYLVLFSGYKYVNGQYQQDYFIYRFFANGQTDRDFGNSGRTAVDFIVRQFFIQADGKLLICGQADDEIVLARFLSNGSSDTGFGYKGIAYTGLYFGPNSCLLLKSGKILIAASYQNEKGSLLVMLEANGNRDFTFGDDGLRYYSYDMTNFNRYIGIMKEMDDGKILMGATVYGNNQIFASMIRLSNTYQYDSTFSRDGEQTLGQQGFNIQDFRDAGAGRLVVAGYFYYNNYQSASTFVTRLKADGTPDSSFGNRSIRTGNFGGARDFCFPLLIQPDGKTVLAGSSDSRFGLSRYTAAGSLDVQFNSNGKSTAAIPNASYAGIRYMEMEADGRLLVAGYAYNKDSTASFILSMYHTAYNTSLAEVSPEPELSLYPNPAGSSCTVSYTLQQAEAVSISLYDVNGRLLLSKSSDGLLAAGLHAEALDLQGLATGMYVLVISHGTTSMQTKLLKD